MAKIFKKNAFFQIDPRLLYLGLNHKKEFRI